MAISMVAIMGAGLVMCAVIGTVVLLVTRR